jgi:hypothetical protein
MISKNSTHDEINAFYAAKIAEYMKLVDEMEQLRGRDMSAGRNNFMDSWGRYNPLTNKFVNIDMATKWIDGEIAGLTRRLETQRQRA